MANNKVNEGKYLEEKLQPETAVPYKNNLLPVCLVCETTPPGGFTEGIFINGKFLCTACEQLIMTVTVDDTNYPFIIDKLKKLW